MRRRCDGPLRTGNLARRQVRACRKQGPAPTRNRAGDPGLRNVLNKPSHRPLRLQETLTMKDNVKRVFHVLYLAHSCYADIIAKRPEIRLDKLENDTPEGDAAPIIAAAHAYQISSARDETPFHYHAHKELLARAPN